MEAWRREMIKKSALSLLDTKINKMPETWKEFSNLNREIFILVIGFDEYSKLQKESFSHENMLIIHSKNEVLPKLPLELNKKNLIYFEQPKLKESIFKDTSEEDSMNYMLNGILKYIKGILTYLDTLPIIMLSPKIKMSFKSTSYTVLNGEFKLNFMNLSYRNKFKGQQFIYFCNRDEMPWLNQITYQFTLKGEGNVQAYCNRVIRLSNEILNDYPKDDELNYLRKRLEFIIKKLRPLTLAEYFALDHSINVDENILEGKANLKGIQNEDKNNNEIEELTKEIDENKKQTKTSKNKKIIIKNNKTEELVKEIKENIWL